MDNTMVDRILKQLDDRKIALIQKSDSLGDQLRENRDGDGEEFTDEERIECYNNMKIVNGKIDALNFATELVIRELLGSSEPNTYYEKEIFESYGA